MSGHRIGTVREEVLALSPPGMTGREGSFPSLMDAIWHAIATRAPAVRALDLVRERDRHLVVLHADGTALPAGRPHVVPPLPDRVFLIADMVPAALVGAPLAEGISHSPSPVVFSPIGPQPGSRRMTFHGEHR